MLRLTSIASNHAQTKVVCVILADRFITDVALLSSLLEAVLASLDLLTRYFSGHHQDSLILMRRR